MHPNPYCNIEARFRCDVRVLSLVMWTVLKSLEEILPKTDGFYDSGLL
jgi:hypothetical protein